jgi:Fur family ferric uptake transcriptional regulator
MTEDSWFLKAVEASKLRLTGPRRAVIETMTPHLQRLHPEELAAECSTGRATVYRVLKLLAERGLLCRVVRENGSVFYHASTQAHRQHVLCTGCGSVEEMATRDVERSLQASLRQSGYTSVAFRIEATGLCPRCQLLQSPA